MAIRLRLPIDLVLVLCGISLGTGLALSIATSIRIKEGRSDLVAYARRLVAFGDHLGEEDTEAIARVSNDQLAFCSDQELAFMRDYVYRSPHIRDLGRIKDGKLYCSTGVGVLKTPRLLPAPDISTGGLNLSLNIPLVFSPDATGFVVQKNGVSVALNPDAIEHLDEPPRFYSAFLYDRLSHRMTQTFGSAVPLSIDELLAGKLVERNGVFYQPLCSPTSMVCQVAYESRSDILSRPGTLFLYFLIGGSLLGTALAMIGVLFHRQRGTIERQLRRAIRRDELTLVYQPVVDLETRAIIGAEALVRWINESGETVRPDNFVSVAEERGFAGEITRLVLRKATRELCDLLSQGNFRLTLNITAEDLNDRRFFQALEQSIRSANLDRAAIGLELTERSTADQKVAIQAISELRQAGHAVYIDDFGTGYSSLSYLHHLAVDAIKVDRGFTQAVGTNAVIAMVVPLILNVAAELGLTVVVEGIETEDQAAYFRSAGAGILAQGWLFGRPMPAAQLNKFIRDHRRARTSLGVAH